MILGVGGSEEDALDSKYDSGRDIEVSTSTSNCRVDRVDRASELHFCESVFVDVCRSSSGNL